MYPKFVVADRTDIHEAGKAVEEYKALGIECLSSYALWW